MNTAEIVACRRGFVKENSDEALTVIAVIGEQCTKPVGDLPPSVTGCTGWVSLLSFWGGSYHVRKLCNT